MLFKITKKIAIILIILLLTGCTETSEKSTNESSINCGYQYTYGCGFDVMSGTNKCGYGYIYTCRV